MTQKTNNTDEWGKDDLFNKQHWVNQLYTWKKINYLLYSIYKNHSRYIKDLNVEKLSFKTI